MPTWIKWTLAICCIIGISIIGGLFWSSVLFGLMLFVPIICFMLFISYNDLDDVLTLKSPVQIRPKDLKVVDGLSQQTKTQVDFPVTVIKKQKSHDQRTNEHTISMTEAESLIGQSIVNGNKDDWDALAHILKKDVPQTSEEKVAFMRDLGIPINECKTE